MTELQGRFEQYIVEQQLCHPSRHRILVAVSGGRDSVLLLRLLVNAGYQLGVAHCNFSLRGRESDLDEALVRKHAEKLGLPFYTQTFQTSHYADSRGLSIQMAARELRYGWFETLCQDEKFDLVAVAHHATDNVETVLINQLRGTGIRGLRGMLPKSGHLIRPLLFLTAKEIADAVQQAQLEYRDDLSNFSTDYIRNKLRLEVSPRLREINPQLEHTFSRNMEAVREVQDFLDEQVAIFRREWIRREGEGEILRLDALLQYGSFRLLLYELLRPYGFSASVVADIAASLQSENGTKSGLQFFSPNHQLLIDRAQAVIRPYSPDVSGAVGKEHSAGSDQKGAVQEGVWMDRQQAGVNWANHRFELTFCGMGDFTLPDNAQKTQTKAYFDADKVRFPLQIRYWKEGDVFRPFGMGGKHKKLSDFFTGLKLSRWEKEEVPLVVDAAGNIIWATPYRVSSDYNICDETKNVMTLSYFCQNG